MILKFVPFFNTNYKYEIYSFLETNTGEGNDMGVGIGGGSSFVSYLVKQDKQTLYTTEM